MKYSRKAIFVPVIAVISTMFFSIPAQADSTEHSVQVASATTNIVKSEDVALTFERPAVSSTPAPIEIAVPAPAVEAAVSNPEPVIQTVAQALPRPQQVAPVQPTPVKASTASGLGGTILAAALAQLGVAQDCTALVEKSLRAAGVQGVGDESPFSLERFGHPVSDPQPGDILIYANGGAGSAHVAIYAGNGMAVHGGFNGSTVLFSAYVGSGFTAYRV